MTETFTIFTVDEIRAREIQESNNVPHHHPHYEELIIGIQGKLEHFIDFRSTVMDAPCVSFVAKGKVHRVLPLLENGKCLFWVIRFKSEFIAETIFQLYAHYHDNANLQLHPDFCFNRLVTLCEMMHEETRQTTPDYGVIRHLLSALFTMIEAERRKMQPEIAIEAGTVNETFRNFLNILEDNFRRAESVEFYAEKLFMSSRNLNIICQNIMQQSVSEIIETRKLIEAKNLLTTTDKPISEIGFELGYNEKSYFSNVFRKRAGMTPSEFRKEMTLLVQ